MIINDEQRRAMDFIATVNRGGHRPTGREINEWRRRPDPKPRRKGKLLEPAVPAVPATRIRTGLTAVQAIVESYAGFHNHSNNTLRQMVLAQQGITSLHSSLMRYAVDTARATHSVLGYGYEEIPATPGKPAVYAADKPAETFLGHLRRLGWVERDNRGCYAVTLLGHALLKAEAAADAGKEDSSVMVLTAENELAYGQVLGVIAECGDALIVDGYLGARELAHILTHTNASRFLIGDRLAKGRVTELAVQVNLAPPNDDGQVREMRRASFHDRYLIGEHKLYGLSSSLNGIGTSMATLVEMPDMAARVIRANAEALWAGGETVASGLRADGAAADTDGDDVSNIAGRGVQQEDGRYLHGGCTVRHRSQAAAERCTNAI